MWENGSNNPLMYQAVQGGILQQYECNGSVTISWMTLGLYESNCKMLEHRIKVCRWMCCYIGDEINFSFWLRWDQICYSEPYFSTSEHPRLAFTCGFINRTKTPTVKNKTESARFDLVNFTNPLRGDSSTSSHNILYHLVTSREWNIRSLNFNVPILARLDYSSYRIHTQKRNFE